MRSFLINKNLSLYYWLKKRIGKKWALGVAGTIEKVVLMFGREALPCSNGHRVDTQEQESTFKRRIGERGQRMLAYKFYWCDEKGKDHLIGILPERRKDSERVNEESIMNWLRMVIGNPEDIDSGNIYYRQVEM